MRSDMGKVIVDLGRINSDSRNPSVVGDRRLRGEALTRDLPKRSQMKPRSKDWHREKVQTDRLGPLERFLASECKRPWDKVYSEICNSQDFRTLMGDHFLVHLNDYVTVKPLYNEEGQPCIVSRGGTYKLRPGNFYVDVHGLLQQVKKPRDQLSVGIFNFKQVKEKLYICRPSDNVWFELLFSARIDTENFIGYGYSSPLEWIKAIVPFKIYNARLCKLRTLSKKEKNQLGLK